LEEKEEYLTAKEVSQLLKIHPSTPYKWIKKNAFPFFRLGEKCVRFKKSDIESFIQQGREQELHYRKKRFW
jgi:excisionase family DNA binding protein